MLPIPTTYTSLTSVILELQSLKLCPNPHCQRPLSKSKFLIGQTRYCDKPSTKASTKASTKSCCNTDSNTDSNTEQENVNSHPCERELAELTDKVRRQKKKEPHRRSLIPPSTPM